MKANRIAWISAVAVAPVIAAIIFSATKPHEIPTGKHSAISRESRVSHASLRTFPEIGRAITAAQDMAEKHRLAEMLVAADDLEAIQTLADACAREKTAEAREAVATALQAFSGQSQDARDALTSIIAFCQDDTLLAEARATISRFADADTVDYLRELYDEQAATDETRLRILGTLENLENPETATGLAQILDHPDSPLRAAASLALAGLGTPQSIGFILQSVKPDDDLAVQEPLLAAFRRIDNPELVGVLEEAGQRAVSPLLYAAIDSALQRLRAE